MQNKIELLAPAGDLEKLKIAVLYGADAVYLGGENFGLRAKAKNFTIQEMQEGIEFAHSNGVKVYVTCNIFAHNEDFSGMEEYFRELERIKADALIIADPGVFSVAKRVIPNMPIHISTQSNTTNYETAMFWKELGVSRIVTARELSADEIRTMADKLNGEMEIESFIHGAMCISYSGRCLLSNYFSARDANKGECSHPCRWRYHIVEQTRPNEFLPIEEDERGTFIFNSKDLCMISYIPQLIEAGITSFKIEGRIKTSYYVGTIVKIYREAIDDYLSDPERYEGKKAYYEDEIKKASYRGFTTGFYFKKPDENQQIYTSSSYIRNYDFAGMVLDYDSESGMAEIEQRNKFVVGDEVEFVSAKGENFIQTVAVMYDMFDNEVTEAPHPQQKLRVKVDKPVNKFDMMRKECLD